MVLLVRFESLYISFAFRFVRFFQIHVFYRFQKTVLLDFSEKRAPTKVKYLLTEFHSRKPEKIHFLYSCWRNKISKNTDVFLRARADYLSIRLKCACDRKTIRKHFKVVRLAKNLILQHQQKLSDFKLKWRLSLDLFFSFLFSQLFDSILLTLPRQTGGGGKSSAEVIAELSADILSKFPPPFDMEMVMNKYPVVYEESMNTVLRQELIRFNRLTEVVRSTLYNLQKAIKVMFYLLKALTECKGNIRLECSKCSCQSDFLDCQQHPSLRASRSHSRQILLKKRKPSVRAVLEESRFQVLTERNERSMGQIPLIQNTIWRKILSRESRASLLNEGFTVKLFDIKKQAIETSPCRF